MFPEQKENEWIKPIMENYKAECCDCGLVHEIDFRVVEILKRFPNGENEYQPVEGNFEIEFRVRRK